MTLKITDKVDYILVGPATGMDYWEILESIPKLLLMPEFKDKNDIWVFREGRMNILLTDFSTIKDVVNKFHPKESKGRKTAIVVGNGLQHGLASLYSKIGKDLPREIKVFTDLKLAEDWITQDSVQDTAPCFRVASL